MVSPDISHTIFFESEHEKNLFAVALRNLKYKTGMNYNAILQKALNEYNLIITEKNRGAGI